MVRHRKRQMARSGECVHCGVVGELTDDHVPPECIFPESARTGLIVVPSCIECNGGASKDDEHFRLMLTMRADTSDLRAAEEVVASVWRSLERPEARRFATSFRSTFIKRPVFTESGIYLGTAPTFPVDRSRLARVVERTVKGIFFAQTGHRLADDHAVSCWDELALTAIPEETRPFWNRLYQHTVSKGPSIVCADVFQYWHHVLHEDPNISSWFLLFYGKVPFFCITRPIAMTERIDALLNRDNSTEHPQTGSNVPRPSSDSAT